LERHIKHVCGCFRRSSASDALPFANGLSSSLVCKREVRFSPYLLNNFRMKQWIALIFVQQILEAHDSVEQARESDLEGVVFIGAEIEAGTW
jgi:hypothetical protein